MNFRLTAILFVIILLLVGGLLVAALWDDAPPPTAMLLSSLTGAKEADIDVVELARAEPNEQKLVFARAGRDKWEMREPSTGKLDAALVNRIVADLLKLKPTVSPDLTGNLSLHGLDKPTLKVTLKAGTRSATLNLGETTIGGERAVTFVTTADRATVPVAVKRSDVASLFRDGTKDGKAWQLARWVSDYRQKKLIGGDLPDAVMTAKAVRIRAGGKELALTKGATNDWVFDTPAGYGLADIAGDPAAKPEVLTGVRALMLTLTSLQAATPADYIEAPEPLETYGLKPDDANVVRIELVGGDGTSEVVFLGKKADEKAAPAKVYAKVQGDGCVVTAQTDRLDALLKTVADPGELRDRNLISELRKDSIDALEITAGSSVIKARKVSVAGQREWVLYGGPTDPQLASPAMASLLDALARPRVAAGILPAPLDTAFVAPQAVIKVWYDGLAEKPATADPEKLPAEPKLKDGPPAVTMTVGKAEGDFGYVRRTPATGAASDLKVPMNLITQMIKPRTSYLQPSLKSFATNFATKLTFTRGGETFEIDRSETADADFPLGKWTFAKPDRMKGSIADVDKVGGGPINGIGLIGALATMSPDRVVSEQPTEAELKAWGIAPPRLAVAVVIKDEKEKSRSYEFGNETDDKGFVYARIPGKPAVFTVPRVNVDLFFNDDLRDRTPYRIDPKAVKAVKFRGWKKTAGSLVEYEYERAADGWKMTKGPTPLTADGAMIESFLAHAKAPKPLAVVPGLLPEYGFDAGKEGDPLEVTLVGNTGPIVVLNFGNEVDGTTVYVWQSATNETLKLPAGSYHRYREGPEVFGKK